MSDAKDLDLLATDEILALMNDADARAVEAVREAIPKITRCVDEIAKVLRTGGRLHTFGAGTSGRLAVLDASEIPPTFGTAPEIVQGHIAGGPAALTRAIEGAEDDEADGEDEVARSGIGPRDAVIVVTASGRTPWCLGVLRKANEIGARTYAVTCAADSAVLEMAGITIDPPIGDEVVRGSTRLSAGTAQKLVLNMISTAVMVRLGKTYGNLMIGVQATNAKLRARAHDIIAAVAGTSEGIDEALDAAGNDVALASLMVARGVERAEAARLLASAGSLRRALARSSGR